MECSEGISLTPVSPFLSSGTGHPGPTQGCSFPLGHLLPVLPRGCPGWSIFKCPGLAWSLFLDP